MLQVITKVLKVFRLFQRRDCPDLVGEQGHAPHHVQRRLRLPLGHQAEGGGAPAAHQVQQGAPHHNVLRLGKLRPLKRLLQVQLSFAAVNSNWLFVGTERGNTHVLKLDTFTLSGYIINWNKAIGVMASAHPGSVTHLLGE